MLQPSTFKFLKELANHNVKEWFDTNRNLYDLAKEDVVTLVNDMIKEHSKNDPSIAEQEGKKCVMRINRDIRFSKDKTPYKNNFGISIPTSGTKAGGAEYYLHIQPGKSFIAGGYWMPDAVHLKAIRQEIDYNAKDLTTIIDDAEFVKLFGKFTGSKRR